MTTTDPAEPAKRGTSRRSDMDELDGGPRPPQAGERQLAVHRVPSRVSSAYVIEGDRPVIVDTGVATNEEAVLRLLADRGIWASDVSLIVLTHAHADHVGCAPGLRERTGAPVAIHRLDAGRLRRGGRNPHLPPVGLSRWLPSRLFERQVIPPLDADIVIDDELDLAAFGVTGRVVHTPGHTPGSVTVALQNGDVLVGDLVCGGFIRPGRPGLPYFAEDLSQVRQSIRHVLDLEPATVYSGHGGPFAGTAVRRAFAGWL